MPLKGQNTATAIANMKIQHELEKNFFYGNINYTSLTFDLIVLGNNINS